MNKNYLILVFLLLTCACNNNKAKSADSLVSAVSVEEERISWIPFTWKPIVTAKDTLKYGSMEILVDISGMGKDVAFQLDLGASNSMIYENPMKQLFPDPAKYPFDVSTECNQGVCPIDHIHIAINHFHFHDLQLYFVKSYGDKKVSETNPLIGTIGIDLIENSYLIMDYKNQKIGLARELSGNTLKKISFVNFEKNDLGKIIFKVDINGKLYNAMFDTAQSFSMVACESKFKEIYGANIVSEKLIGVSSMGQKETFSQTAFKGRLIVAGQPVEATSAYYYKDNDLSAFLSGNNIELIVGNALFLDKTVVIDRINNRIGFLE